MVYIPRIFQAEDNLKTRRFVSDIYTLAYVLSVWTIDQGPDRIFPTVP